MTGLVLHEFGHPPPERTPLSVLILRLVNHSFSALPLLTIGQIRVVAEVEVLFLQQLLHTFELLDHIRLQWRTQLAICFDFREEGNEVDALYLVYLLSARALAHLIHLRDHHKEELVVEEGEDAEDAMMRHLVVRFHALLLFLRLFALFFLLVY